MEFERGNTVKEALKIGRIANAIHIDNFEIWGKITHPANPKNFDEDSHSKGIHFSIAKEALIQGLKILEEGGVCEEFDDYVHDLMKKYWIRSNKDRGISLPYREHDIIPNLKTLYIIKGPRQIPLTFSLTGKDLLYKDKLYRIAEPRDGD